MGGKFHPKLNTCGRPIANKYREGKMKRTLKRESKVLEIAENEGMASSNGLGILRRGGESRVPVAIDSSLPPGHGPPPRRICPQAEVRMDSGWFRNAPGRWLSPHRDRPYRPGPMIRPGSRCENPHWCSGQLGAPFNGRASPAGCNASRRSALTSERSAHWCDLGS